MRSQGRSLARMTFNVVLTGGTFWHLRFFVCSLIEQSDAEFRLVANGCTPEGLSEIQEFARRHRNRVVEVLDVSPTAMVGHGVALDVVRRVRDDGELFCFVDPDIKARQPFLGTFRELLSSYDAVTSGNEVWTDDNVVPSDHPGLGGRHFYDAKGFVFGSPHFAIYLRDPLNETLSRWGVGLGSAGPDLSAATRAQLADAGHKFRVYDTGKIANILLQLDGHTLCHFDHPELVHIGGLSHFLAPGEAGGQSGEETTPRWARFEMMKPRLEVARYTAAVLRASSERRACPPLPLGLDSSLRARLEFVRTEVTDLVDRYRDC